MWRDLSDDELRARLEARTDPASAAVLLDGRDDPEVAAIIDEVLPDGG